MTNDEINIAIAEVCGKLKCWPHKWEWAIETYYHPDTGIEPQYRTLNYYACSQCGETRGSLVADIPNVKDYCSDLNAMHEAEKVLDEAQVEAYGITLWTLIHPKHTIEVITKGCFSGKGVFMAVHATAQQRAEAFLRTVGKWKD